MSTQRALRVAWAAADQLLKLTYESADVFPPLKSVIGGALHITDLVAKFRTRKQEWQEFSAHVEKIVASIIESLKFVDVEQTEIRGKLEEFQSVLDGIAQTIETKQREGFRKSFLHFMGHPDMIAELRKKVDEAVCLLLFDSVVKTEIKVDKTMKMAENNNQLLSKADRGATLSKLQYVDDASWDPRRVCLADTRSHIIQQVFSWVEDTDGSHSTNVLLLTGVAGAGKSTVAHTIAQHYARTKQLVTSFFFDRETNNRNNPKHLISTIAVDLCQSNEQLAKRIRSRIEEDERAAHYPVVRQFEELILQPCKDLPAGRPLVVVLDALDEGYDDDLLWVLREAARLPSRFRFFMTSRMFPKLEVLRQKSHVHSLVLEIHTPENIDDIALFVPTRLKQVAEYHGLDDNWPGQTLVGSFTTRAEGLFLWVSIVCDYLLTRSDPTIELQKLLSMTHMSNISAESQMDKLYITILQACNWEDEAFVDDYNRVIGAAVASKTPLTLGALGSLFQRVPFISNLARRQLSALLTGLGEDQGLPQLVRFLHLSLHDFLTQRVLSPSLSVDIQKFAIDGKAHSQILALQCLIQMNCELNSNIAGLGYLAESDPEAPGIPTVLENHVSEELWYSCRFWMDHLLDVDLPLSLPMLKQLEELLEEGLILWMEIMAMYGRFEGLSKLQNLVKEQAIEQGSLASLVFNESQGSALCSLSERLNYMGRFEEALTAAREGVAVYRQLMEGTSSESCKGLSRSLHTLSVQLRSLGYHEDALQVSEEAVNLRRQLAIEQPTEFNSELATSVNELSINLSNLGRHEEGLKATEETVQLRRQLASERPAVFTSDLATSVHNLSADLTRVGRYEEALKATEEAVKLKRKLANERPAAFTAVLASSVHSLSIDLAGFGRHEEALESIEEAVKLRRQLANERPAVFTGDLADSVHELSVRLASFGRHKEALEAIEEAVKLRRQLASERPAAFTSDLAYSVHELSVRLASVGRHEEALEAIEEAVKLQRQLASVRPAAFTSDLAASVHELSVCLYDLGRHEEALKASEEAVELRRQLASERPAAFTPNLAISLCNLAIDYNHRGWHQKALATIKESADIFHPFAEKYPARYATEYSIVLRLLEQYSTNAGTDKEALTASAAPNAAALAE